MPATTILADAIDALVDLLTADVALNAIDGLKVFDGPPTGDRARRVEVWVGHNGSEDEEPIPVTLTPVALGQGVVDEMLDIPCAVGEVSGAKDIRPRRRAAVEAFDAIVTAVRGWDLSTFGPNVTADVVSAQLRQFQGADGSSAHLMFTVRLAGFWS